MDKKKAAVIALNLVAGNLILWFFEITRHQETLHTRFFFGFSASAIIALLIAFKFERKGQSFVRSFAWSVVVSALTLFFGTLLSLTNFSLNVFLNSIVIAAAAVVTTREWGIPMIILNSILFHWLSRPKNTEHD